MSPSTGRSAAPRCSVNGRSGPFASVGTPGGMQTFAAFAANFGYSDIPVIARSPLNGRCGVGAAAGASALWGCAVLAGWIEALGPADHPKVELSTKQGHHPAIG